MRTKLKTQMASALMFAMCACPAEAQRSTDPDFIASGYWAVSAIDAPTPAETSSHTVGELLFHQSFRSTVVAHVTADASFSVPGVTRWNQSPGQVTLARGATLLRLTNVGANTIFCSGQSSYRASTIWDDRNWRACLYDRESDGIFDHIMWMPVTDINNFGGMFVLRDGRAEAEVSIPYTVENTPDSSVFIGGPVITRGALGAYRVTLGMCRNDRPVVFDARAFHESRITSQAQPADAASVWFFKQDLPVTVDLDGARITITAIEGDQASLQVLSAFDSSSTLALWYNHQLPAPCDPAR